MHAVVSKFTLHGIEGILTEKIDALNKFMTNITALVNLGVLNTNVEEQKQILEIAKKFDYGTRRCITVFSGEKRKHREKIISYETDFDNTPLKRVEPGELIR